MERLPSMMPTKESSDAYVDESHYLVKAYSNTSTAIISELFNICREASSSGDEETIAESIGNLKDHINAYISHLMNKHITTINEELTRTFASDRLLGVGIIEALIDVPYMESSLKRSRFANSLNTALTQADTERSVDAVCKALQMLVKDAGSLTPSIVEANLVKSFEWLECPPDALGARAISHYAACRTLKILGQDVPELIKPHLQSVEQFLGFIWNPLCSVSATTRLSAQSVVDQFLDTGILAVDILASCVQQVEACLMEQDSEHFWHGALLMLASIVRHSKNPPYYVHVVQIALCKKYYRETHCRMTLLGLLPSLATMSDRFQTCHFNQVLTEILYPLATKGDGPTKSCVFIAMAELIANIGSGVVSPHLNDIMAKVKSALQLSKEADDIIVEALKCLGEIAKVADKAWLHPHVEELISALFRRGLNSYLTDALTILGKSVPEFIPTFQQNLLNTISNALHPEERGHRPRSASTPRGHRRGDSGSGSSGNLPDVRGSMDASFSRNIKEDERIIAMRTLATFNPKANSTVLKLVSTHVLPFLSDVWTELRIASVRTTLQLLSSFVEPVAGGEPENSGLIGDTLGKIVDVGVADISEAVRFTVLSCIDPRLDFYLASPDYLETLFMGLHDEKLNVREETLRVICRLAKLHPAYIVPGLKRIQTQFVAELQHSRNLSQVEHSARMLLHMVRSGIAVEIPNSQQRLQDLVLEKIQTTGAYRLSATLLELLGGIAQHVGVSQQPKQEGEIPIFDDVIAAVEDQTSTLKRRAALGALTNIVRATSVVADAFYTAHPGFLRTQVEFLHGEGKGDSSTRREVMRLMGVIGAIDPSKVRMMQLEIGTQAAVAPDEEIFFPDIKPEKVSGGSRAGNLQERKEARRNCDRFIERTPLPMRCSSKVSDRYPAVVLTALVKVLSASSTSHHYQTTMKGFAAILKILNPAQLQPHVALLLPIFLDMLKDTRSQVGYMLHADAFGLIHSLLVAVRINKDPQGMRYATDVMKVLRIYCEESLDMDPSSTSRPLPNLIALLEEIAKSFPTVVGKEIRWIFNFLVQRMIDDRTEKRETSLRVISCFESFVSVGKDLDKDIYYIVPLILNYIKPNAQSANGIAINLRSLSFLALAAQQSNFKEISARTIHHLLRLLELNNNKEVEEATMNVLCEILLALGKLGGKFIPLIQKYSQAKEITYPRFEKLVKEYTEKKSFTEDSKSQRPKGPISLPTTPMETVPMVILLTMNREVTKQALISEVAEAMAVHVSTVEVLSIQRIGMQTTVEFRFVGTTAEKTHQSFLKKLQEKTLPKFKIDFGKEKVYQQHVPVGPQLMERFSRVFLHDGEGKIQPGEWFQWMDELAVELIRSSSDPAIKCLATLAQEYVPLARDIFPFAFYCVYSSLDLAQQETVMSALSKAVLSCGKETMQVLVRLAEFVEPYRTYNTILLKVTRPSEERYVSRSNTIEKFGIGYGDGVDYKQDDPWFHNRVVITKVGENSAGAAALVPMGWVLVSIDGTDVRRVSEINKLLDGKLNITLNVQQPVQIKYIHEMKPSFDMPAIVKATTEARLFAKSLHFAETIFFENTDEDNLEKFEISNELMELYQQLGLRAAANGLLEVLKKAASRIWGDDVVTSEDRLMEKISCGLGVSAALEKLQIYPRAIELYHRAIADARADDELPAHSVVMGLCRCFRQKGHWLELLNLSKEHWPICNASQRAEVAQEAALASWFLGDWTFYEAIIGDLPPEKTDFFKCVSMVRQKHFEDAQKCIDACRQQLDANLSSLIAESYHRAYKVVAKLQNLSELEEVITYMQNDDKRPGFRSVWSKRMNSLAAIPQMWQTSLAIRSLVLTPEQDIDSWLRFAGICRKCDRPHMAEYALSRLIGVDLHTNLIFEGGIPTTCNPLVVMAYLKFVRQLGHRQEAVDLLEKYVENFSQRPDIEKEQKARFHFLLGEWKQDGLDHYDTTQVAESVASVSKHLEQAKDLDKTNFYAWHSWAMLNFRTAVLGTGDAASDMDEETRRHYLLTALQGFIQTVQLDRSRVIGVGDVLRILYIWFHEGHKKMILKEMNVGIEKLGIDTWLGVIPQLISRLDIIHTDVRDQLHRLLIRLGTEHPCALIHPLAVCAKSSEDSIRKTAAKTILDTIHKAKPALVDEFALISDELIRVAISWWDRWYDAIESVAKVKGENEAKAYQQLAPLYALLEKPQTRDEKLFHKTLMPLLERAWKLVEGGKLSDAWTVYKQVHSKLHEKITNFPKVLALDEVSPILAEKTTSVCIVPGTYKANQPPIMIKTFAKDVKVITSKQRPRRVVLSANDGKEYKFLLKGHEDLRMDERVMQLFTLLNTFFENDSHLASIVSIVTYSVVPLSENVGLIRWVDSTETIYAMITSYRAAHYIPITMECSLLQQLEGLKHINDFANVPRHRKKDMLQYVLDNTPSDDLKLLFWERNESSESWLEYRTNYIRSTAMMSMVGYILGLGDRHLNNLMMHKKGKTVHIDFGDCFEVAQARERFPEMVPFRLTRMLVCAMEACGLEGTFRYICESVITLLRKHRESVISLLETFAHDPLVSWRLDMLNKTEGQDADKAKSNPAVHVDTIPASQVLEDEDYVMSRSCREKVMRSMAVQGTNSDSIVKIGQYCRLRWNEIVLETQTSASVSDDGCNPPQAQEIPQLGVIISALHEHIAQTVEEFEPNFVRAVRTFKEGVKYYHANPHLFLKGEDEIESFMEFVRITYALTSKNNTAKQVLKRVKDKLYGTDFIKEVVQETLPDFEQPDPNMIFLATSYVEESHMASAFDQRGVKGGSDTKVNTSGPLLVSEQVRRLVEEATSVDNLCSSYIGWCPFW